MKYLSLFSGIGGFETAIQAIHPDWECIGFSEIDPYAIRVYESHYPHHTPLGDVCKISRETLLNLGTIDLVVGGFPCKNLSSMARINGDSRGLNGSQSRLFTEFHRILKLCKEINPSVKFCMENNASMSKMWKKSITDTLRDDFEVFVNEIDNATFGVQQRKRILWTNFPIPEISLPSVVQTWGHVLEPIQDVKSKFLSDKMITCLNKTYSKLKSTPAKIVVKNEDRNVYTYCDSTFCGKSRWEIQPHSDTAFPKSRPIITCGGANNILFDRRVESNGDALQPRYFSILETERLFGFPDGYTKVIPMTRRYNTLGNSIPIFLVKYVLQSQHLG